MSTNSLQFEELAKKVEAHGSLGGKLASEVADAINTFTALQPGLPAATGSKPVKPADLESTHQVLHLVDRLTPGWTIKLRGKAFEPDGHWTCSLRPTDSRDDAEVVGYAQGPELSMTLVVALLRVLAYLSQKTK